MSEESEDSKLRGGQGAAELPRNIPPKYVVWIAPVIVGLFTILNGWFAYVATTNKALVEASLETVTDRTKELKERVDKLEDRLTYLEQMRMSDLELEKESSSGDV